jgi:DNA-binding transcriptional MerR regulator
MTPSPTSDEPAGREYTIDELAAHTRVPSRTVRFYQSKGALHKPALRGRKAVYDDSHVERLELINTLQERGLRIKAIRDLVQRIDSGELDLDEWLGLEARLHSSTADAPKLYTADELKALVGEGRKGVIADLLRLGLVERKGSAFLATSPALIAACLKMEGAGIDLEVAKEAIDLSAKHLQKLARVLSDHYVKHAGDGFGRSTAPADLSEAFEVAGPIGQTIVRTVFANEMEAIFRELVESGRMAQLASRKR